MPDQKTAIITGSIARNRSRFSRAFLKQGYNVVANVSQCKSTVDCLDRPGSHRCDIGKPETPPRSSKAAIKNFGSIDVCE